MDGFSQLRFTGKFVDQGLARDPYIPFFKSDTEHKAKTLQKSANLKIFDLSTLRQGSAGGSYSPNNGGIEICVVRLPTLEWF